MSQDVLKSVSSSLTRKKCKIRFNDQHFYGSSQFLLYHCQIFVREQFIQNLRSRFWKKVLRFCKIICWHRIWWNLSCRACLWWSWYHVNVTHLMGGTRDERWLQHTCQVIENGCTLVCMVHSVKKELPRLHTVNLFYQTSISNSIPYGTSPFCNNQNVNSNFLNRVFKVLV